MLKQGRLGVLKGKKVHQGRGRAVYVGAAARSARPLGAAGLESRQRLSGERWGEEEEGRVAAHSEFRRERQAMSTQ